MPGRCGAAPASPGKDCPPPAPLPAVPAAPATAGSNAPPAASGSSSRLSLRLGRVRHTARAVKSAAKRTWHRDEIEALVKSLEDAQRVMQSTVLVQMYESGQAQAVLGTAEFKGLEAGLRGFVCAVAKQQFNLSQLMMAKYRELHQETRDVMRRDMATIEEARIMVAEMENLRTSVWYPEMNLRYNEVKKSHESSLGWLFGNALVQVAPSESDSSDDDDGGVGGGGDNDRVGQRLPWYTHNAYRETHGSFSHWLEHDTQSKLYWVSGKAGAGKSTLMKYLNMQLSGNTFVQGPHIVIRHFFKLGPTRTQSRQNDMEGMFSTLLYQLLDVALDDKKVVSTHLLQKKPSLRQKVSYLDWTLGELESALREALKVLDGRHLDYILIDALDEHLPVADNDLLLRKIRKLQKEPNVRLVVSSRREPIFRDALANSKQLRLEALNAPDISRFAANSLYSPIRSAFPGQSSNDFLEYCVRNIAEKSEGVFLWARLAVESLKSGLVDRNTEDVLRRRLDDMPSDLVKFFKSIWKRLGDNEKRYQTKAANVFSILLSTAWNKNTFWDRNHGADLLCIGFALSLEAARSQIQCLEESFTTRELLELCKQTQNMVVSHCAGLVEIVPDKASAKDTSWDICFEIDPGFPSPNALLRFIHRSAADFFREEPEGCRIVSTNDLGDNGPEFSVMLAYLARSVAFREAGHRILECDLISKLDIYHWLRSILPTDELGSSLNFDQRHRLLGHCHKFYYEFCGDPHNPRFRNWVFTFRGYRIRPFALAAAYCGHQDYPSSYIDSPVVGRDSATLEFKIAVLQTLLHYKTATKGLFAVLCGWNMAFIYPGRDTPGSLGKLFRSMGSPRTRVPGLALYVSLGGSEMGESLLCGRTVSVSQQLVGLALDLFAGSPYYVRPINSPAERSQDNKIYEDVIVELAKTLIYSGIAVDERVFCIWQPDSESKDTLRLARFKTPFDLAVKVTDRALEFAHCERGRCKLHKNSECGVNVIFETSIHWIIQWLVLNMVSDETPFQANDRVRDLLNPSNMDIRQINNPLPVLLLRHANGFRDRTGETWVYLAGAKAKRPTSDAKELLREILSSRLETTRTGKGSSQPINTEPINGKLQDIWDNPQAQVVDMDKLQEELITLGILCKESEERLAFEACNIPLTRPVDKAL